MAHRYWRLFFPQPGSSGLRIFEVEMAATPGGANQTGSGTASASSSIRPASNAFNGNQTGTNYWQSSGGTDEWLSYDFGVTVDVQEIRIYPQSLNYSPSTAILQWSDDGIDWTTVSTYNSIIWDITSFNKFPKINPGDGTYQYWRILVIETTNGNQPCFYEIEMASTLGGPNLCVISSDSAHASSSSTSRGPNRAFNGDLTTSTAYWYATETAWDSGNNPQWILYDFGSTGENIKEIRIYDRNQSIWGNSSPKHFIIQASIDGNIWEDKSEFNYQVWSLTNTFKSYIVSEFINSDVTFDYSLEDDVTFDSDIVFDYTLDGFSSDITIDYSLLGDLLSSDITFDYRMPEYWESDISFDYTLIETVPNDVTQIVILPLTLEAPPIDVTQIPVLVVALPEQDTSVTQIVLNPVIFQKQVPPPFDLQTGIVGDGLVPEVPVTEVWRYASTVSVTESGREQRMRLRKWPRYSISFRLLILSDLDRYELFNMLFKYQYEEIVYPFYQYSTVVAAEAAQGATRLYFDPARTDMRDGEELAVFEPGTGRTWFASIAAVESDGASLSEPLVRDMPAGAYVCPALRSRFPSPSALRIDTVTGDITLRLETTAYRPFQRIDGNSLLTKLNGVVILDKNPLAGASDELSQNVNWLETKQSEPLGIAKWTSAFSFGERQYSYNRFTESDYWRAFIDHCGGKQGTFLLPTFADDLSLIEVPPLGAQLLTTGNIHADEYMRATTYRYVRIETANGVLYRSITGRFLNYDDSGDPVSLSFGLNQAIGSDSGDNVIRRISFMYLVRLDDDDITVTHYNVNSVIEIRTKAVMA